MESPSQDNIVVSICCITYNHEKYIRDAIEGFLMQETDFPIEIIIHDDASTDSTPDIIREYVDKYPNLFVPIFQTENQYSQGKRIYGTFVLPRARGKYIALCEGDDYWTSPQKLQMQVDYMQAHSECALCFHAAQVVYEDNPTRKEIRSPRPIPRLSQTIRIADWLRQLFIATCTVVFRVPHTPLPDWYYGLRNAGDWPLFLWLALNGGEIRYMYTSEPFAIYRKHHGGVTYASSQIDSPQRKARLLDALSDVMLVRSGLRGYQRKYLRPRAFRLHLTLASEYLVSGDIRESRSHSRKAVCFFLPSTQEFKKMLRIVIQCYFPKLYPKVLFLNAYFRRIRHTIYFGRSH